jgi:hypothetical protein
MTKDTLDFNYSIPIYFKVKADFSWTNRRKRLRFNPSKSRFQSIYLEWSILLLMGEAGAAFAVSNVDNTRDKTSLLSPSIGIRY